MSGAIHLLPLHVFMVWTGTIFIPISDIIVERRQTRPNTYGIRCTLSLPRVLKCLHHNLCYICLAIYSTSLLHKCFESVTVYTTAGGNLVHPEDDRVIPSKHVFNNCYKVQGSWDIN